MTFDIFKTLIPMVAKFEVRKENRFNRDIEDIEFVYLYEQGLSMENMLKMIREGHFHRLRSIQFKGWVLESHCGKGYYHI